MPNRQGHAVARTAAEWLVGSQQSRLATPIGQDHNASQRGSGAHYRQTDIRLRLTTGYDCCDASAASPRMLRPVAWTGDTTRTLPARPARLVQ